MNNKKMDSPVVCAEKSARRIEGAMQMAHTQKSGAGARMNAPRSFIKTKLAKVYHSPRAGAKIFARRIGGELGGFLKPQHLNASSQTGRSMVEMLGVLAIIGVLTIGGLMGYRYAMNKHKANTILNDVSLAMADLTVLDPDGGAITRRAVAFRPDSGLAMEFERTADGNNIVYVSGVAKAVCQILIQIQPTDAYEHIYDGDLNALTTCSDTQAMAFGSKETAEGPDTSECQNDSDCGANQVCQDGRCVDKPAPSDPCENVECFNDGTCNDGSCDCVNGYTGTSCEIEPQCNDSKPCTSPKQCENYICVCPMIGSLNECQEVQKINGCDQLVNKTNATCGTNGFCSNGACSECPSPKVVNTAKNGCECQKIANCKEYNNSTCECTKCEDEFEVVDGKCVKNDCPTGQKSVTNYDSAGNNIGTTCCEVKADYSTSTWSYQNYSVVGAINGTCCGGYSIANSETSSKTASYSIRINETAFCGTEYEFDDDGYRPSWKYLSKDKYCVVDPKGKPINCYCSTSGDPANGSSCTP